MSESAVIVGASRGLGLALATELVRRGWSVLGTVRGSSRTDLHELADSHPDQVTIERVDITDAQELRDLRDRIAGNLFDLLLINAGMTDPDLPVGDVSTAVFTEVMVTNALGPMRAVEILGPRVVEGGTIAVMSSRQGSVGFNTRGGHEVYRASKSALNQLMRSYAARGDDGHALLLVHPGWVQTELGGPGAPLTAVESAQGIADMLEAHAGKRGLEFRDYRDEVVPW